MAKRKKSSKKKPIKKKKKSKKDDKMELLLQKLVAKLGNSRSGPSTSQAVVHIHKPTRKPRAPRPMGDPRYMPQIIYPRAPTMPMSTMVPNEVMSKIMKNTRNEIRAIFQKEFRSLPSKEPEAKYHPTIAHMEPLPSAEPPAFAEPLFDSAEERAEVEDKALKKWQKHLSKPVPEKWKVEAVMEMGEQQGRAKARETAYIGGSRDDLWKMIKNRGLTGAFYEMFPDRYKHGRPTVGEVRKFLRSWD